MAGSRVSSCGLVSRRVTASRILSTLWILFYFVLCPSHLFFSCLLSVLIFISFLLLCVCLSLFFFVCLSFFSSLFILSLALVLLSYSLRICLFFGWCYIFAPSLIFPCSFLRSIFSFLFTQVGFGLFMSFTSSPFSLFLLSASFLGHFSFHVTCHSRPASRFRHM